jgi:hypothetical protein
MYYKNQIRICFLFFFWGWSLLYRYTLHARCWMMMIIRAAASYKTRPHHLHHHHLSGRKEMIDTRHQSFSPKIISNRIIKVKNNKRRNEQNQRQSFLKLDYLAESFCRLRTGETDGWVYMWPADDETLTRAPDFKCKLKHSPSCHSGPSQQ